MEEEKFPKKSRSIVATRNPSQKPNKPLTYFISFSIHKAAKPMIRVKIPKLLAKSMQRKSNHPCNDATSTVKNTKSAKPGKRFPKKVGSIIHNVFGSKKQSREMCGRNSPNGEGNRKFGGLGEEKEESENGCHSVEQNVVCRYWSKESLESEKENYGSKKKSAWRTNLKIFKAKKSSNNCDSSSSSIGVESGSGNEKQRGTSDSPRVSSKRPSSNLKIRRKRFTRKKETNGEENGRKEEEMEREEELCKKRILMGEKCRSLNLSGALHYDKNGTLLPELLSSSDQL